EAPVDAETLYGAILARQERARGYRAAGIEVQSRCAIRPRSHHRAGASIPARDHTYPGRAADKYSLGGFVRSFPPEFSARNTQQGRMNQGRKCEWSRRSEYFWRSGGGANRLQRRLGRDDGWLGCGRADTDDAQTSGGA